MKTRKVLMMDDAKADLRAIHRWIAMQGSPKSASAYLRRIQKFVRMLGTASERGISRGDLVPGLRLIPFESVLLAVLVEDRTVLIARVFHGTQNWQAEFGAE